LREHRVRVTQVHAGHKVALEGVDEALRHAVALRAAHGRADGLEAQRTRQRPGVGCDVGATLSLRNFSCWPAGTASTVPKRRSTA
jgi:hypothetical protein